MSYVTDLNEFMADLYYADYSVAAAQSALALHGIKMSIEGVRAWYATFEDNQEDYRTTDESDPYNSYY